MTVDVKLSDLAVVSYVYNALSNFDASLNRFKKVTGLSFDLNNQEHRKALLVWLNSWGCRHIARKYHSEASESIYNWYKKTKHILEVLPSDICKFEIINDNDIADTFTKLTKCPVGSRNGDEVTFGPTAAAKALYAIKPSFFIPWDSFIRSHFGCDGSGKSYVVFLKTVRYFIKKIETQCKKVNIDIYELPTLVGRPTATVGKIIDEYFWATISRKIKLPNNNILQKWVRWSEVHILRKNVKDRHKLLENDCSDKKI